MAIDVIARPADRVLLIVCDTGSLAITSVAMRGSTILAVLEDGGVMDIGDLSESMRLDAGRCRICIVIEMDGDTVIGSRRVDFSMSDSAAA
jgi:hypothetical protein